MKTNQPLLDVMDIDLHKIDIKLNYLDINLEPIEEIKLNSIDVNLQTLPVHLNPLFKGFTLTSFEDLGGLV